MWRNVIIGIFLLLHPDVIWVLRNETIFVVVIREPRDLREILLRLLLRLQTPLLDVEFQEPVDVDRDVLGGGGGLEPLGVLPEVLQIDHAESLDQIQRGRSRARKGDGSLFRREKDSRPLFLRREKDSRPLFYTSRYGPDRYVGGTAQRSLSSRIRQ